jgi:hypothetical protein
MMQGIVNQNCEATLPIVLKNRIEGRTVAIEASPNVNKLVGDARIVMKVQVGLEPSSVR